MDIEQASFFLTNAILVMSGLVIVTVGITAINNILHRFWRPVKIFTPDSWSGFFPPQQPQEPVERIVPTMKESGTGKK